MKYLIGLFVFFVFFPYLELIPSPTYTQPYALILSGVLFPVALMYSMKKMPSVDIVILGSFFLFGFLVYILTCYPYTNFQGVKYLINYLSFPLIVLASFYAISSYELFVLNILKACVVIWAVVGGLQMLVDPELLTSFAHVRPGVASNIVASGRGVLSLAPEPTHYGFHMIMLAAALALWGQSKYVLICIFQLVLFAKSSSAVLALGLGFSTYILRNPFRLKIILILISSLIIVLYLVYFKNNEDYGNTRLSYILAKVLDDPFQLLIEDHSVNLRLGGAFASFSYMLGEFLVPHGLSHIVWRDVSQTIIEQNSWLLGLSGTGVPSGFGIILFQLGYLALPITVLCFIRFFSPKAVGFNFVIYAVPFIFLGQIYISTPLFGFLVGLLIFRLRPKYHSLDIKAVSTV